MGGGGGREREEREGGEREREREGGRKERERKEGREREKRRKRGERRKRGRKLRGKGRREGGGVSATDLGCTDGIPVYPVHPTGYC